MPADVRFRAYEYADEVERLLWWLAEKLGVRYEELKLAALLLGLIAVAEDERRIPPGEAGLRRLIEKARDAVIAAPRPVQHEELSL